MTYPQGGMASGGVLRDHGHIAGGDGGLLNPETALSPQPEVDFGDGSDGDVTLVADLVLTREMSFNNLSINAGGKIYADGFKIKVKGKFTIAVGREVLAISAVSLTGGAGAAGVGGAGGSAAFVTRRPEISLPTAGAAGGNGVGVGVNVSVSNVPLDVDLIAVTLLHEGRLWAGAGGAGGGAVGNAPTAGGVPLRVLAGAKGGRGADGIYVGGGNQLKGGGGGGGGGGLLEIWANEIDNNGIVFALGGNGGSGEGDANAQAGGGGGGGGGAIIIFYKTLSGGGLGVRNVAGGVGGASFGGVADGLPGAAGYSYAMKIGA
ncbi:MAG: hypothetical protein MUQ25_03805 [Candidatus Aminicenantes bacterium]|nr:hypothetical protein [Candidatus Aminicenantes bacterium]